MKKINILEVTKDLENIQHDLFYNYTLYNVQKVKRKLSLKDRFYLIQTCNKDLYNFIQLVNFNELNKINKTMFKHIDKIVSDFTYLISIIKTANKSDLENQLKPCTYKINCLIADLKEIYYKEQNIDF